MSLKEGFLHEVLVLPFNHTVLNSELNPKIIELLFGTFAFELCLVLYREGNPPGKAGPLVILQLLHLAFDIDIVVLVPVFFPSVPRNLKSATSANSVPVNLHTLNCFGSVANLL